MRPIVVAAPSFEEGSGGTIVLHYLVDRLRSLGYEAYAYPMLRRSARSSRLSITWKNHRFDRNLRRDPGQFRTHLAMDVPLAQPRHIRKGIVVYPEIVTGNPLNARRVVRWVLFFLTEHEKGMQHHEIPAEEVFFYQSLFVENLPWVRPDNELRVTWMMDDVYRQTNFGTRSGACRMVRKGNPDDIPENDEAILLDGRPHEEIARIFNETEFFYCHDPHTMYSTYAVLCGCTPIVLPYKGLTEEQWRPEDERCGLAYGDTPENIAKARRTRLGMFELMAAKKQAEEEQVRHFAQRLAERFP